MTIPQIETVLARLGKHVNLKLGIPISETTQTTTQQAAPKVSTVNDLKAFAGLFGGVG